MLETLLVAMAVMGLAVLAQGLRNNKGFKIDPRLVISFRDERGDDLPCPWCHAPTKEDDSRCRGCGGTFG